jgi:hypothetical protein
LEGNIYEEVFTIEKDHYHNMKAPAMQVIDTTQTQMNLGLGRKNWGVIRTSSLKCGLKNQPRFTDYSFFFSPLKFENFGKINSAPDIEFALARDRLDGIVCDGMKAKLNTPVKFLKGLEAVQASEKYDPSNRFYSHFGQVTSFKLIKI